jgi:regulatory protein
VTVNKLVPQWLDTIEIVVIRPEPCQFHLLAGFRFHHMTVYRITLIESQKRNSKRRNIYLNDAFAFGLDEEVVIRHHLHEGDTISDEMVQTVLHTEEQVRARQKALDLLAYRARSEAEIKDRLTQKGYDRQVIDRVVLDLERVGLLNDTVFASAYVRTRMIQKPMGKRLLIRELLSKGITEPLAFRIAEEWYMTETELDVALKLIAPRLERYRREKPDTIKRRLSDFLNRRGFDWDVIGEVMDWVRRELEQD